MTEYHKWFQSLMGATGRSNYPSTGTEFVRHLFQSLMGATGRSNAVARETPPDAGDWFQSLMGATGRSN